MIEEFMKCQRSDYMELWIESQDIWFVKIINKMQELEQGSDKE